MKTIKELRYAFRYTASGLGKALAEHCEAEGVHHWWELPTESLRRFLESQAPSEDFSTHCPADLWANLQYWFQCEDEDETEIRTDNDHYRMLDEWIENKRAQEVKKV